MASDNPKFKKILAAIGGKTITHVAAGGENGGVVALDFGESYSIFIHCAWRLSRYDKVLSTWNDAVAGDEEEDEDAYADENLAIKKLEGITVDKIEVGDFLRPENKPGQSIQAGCVLRFTVAYRCVGIR